MQGGEPKNGETGIEWEPWRGANYSLKWTEMKVRPFFVWTIGDDGCDRVVAVEGLRYLSWFRPLPFLCWLTEQFNDY